MDSAACSLQDKHCVPCEGGIPPLSKEQYNPLLQEIQGWEVIEDTSLHKTFKFKNFVETVNFVNKIATVAEEEGHHPDLFIHGWNKLDITLTTFAIKGLSENDFILAAKIDHLMETQPEKKGE